MDNDSFLHPILVTKKKCFCNVCGKTFKMETSSHPEEKCEFCSRTFFNPTIQSRDYIYCDCGKMCGHCVRRMIPKQHSTAMCSVPDSPYFWSYAVQQQISGKFGDMLSALFIMDLSTESYYKHMFFKLASANSETKHTVIL